MAIDIVSWIQVGLTIIGVATVLFNIVAPLTEAKWDNKVLKVLNTILETVSLNRDKSKIEIKIK